MKKLRVMIATVFILVTMVMILFLQNKEKSPKYIFLFIGDGMSSAQVELTEIYENSIANNNIDKQTVLTFSKFPIIGIRKNYSLSSYVPDSAASATALASGILTYNGSINIDINGNEIEPITYQLHSDKKKIGIITTVSLNHATPAAFYANATNRSDYNKIAYDLVDSNFEYFAGGGFTGISLDEIKKYATNNGYKIINEVNSYNNINRNNKNIIISPVNTNEEFLPIALDNKTEFNLANYVKKGIEVLNNKNGFFIMAESGLIDIAGHSNDAKSIISEVQELNDAVEVALQFAKKYPKDTLIIVTGDHETGGLVVGDDTYTVNMQSLELQKYSYEKLIDYSNEIINSKISYDDMLVYLKDNYGISNIDLKSVYNETINGNNQILKTTILSIINKEAKISFSTTAHTASRVPVYAYGIGSEKFSGIYDSAEFNRILSELTK